MPLLQHLHLQGWENIQLEDFVDNTAFPSLKSLHFLGGTILTSITGDISAMVAAWREILPHNLQSLHFQWCHVLDLLPLTIVGLLGGICVPWADETGTREAVCVALRYCQDISPADPPSWQKQLGGQRLNLKVTDEDDSTIFSSDLGRTTLSADSGLGS